MFKVKEEKALLHDIEKEFVIEFKGEEITVVKWSRFYLSKEEVITDDKGFIVKRGREYFAKLSLEDQETFNVFVDNLTL